MADRSDEELLAELGIAAEESTPTAHSPREERILAGFADIQRFVAQQGRRPQTGPDRDIFERLYAVRLERLRMLDETRELLAPFDEHGLLQHTDGVAPAADAAVRDDEALLAELGGSGAAGDIFTLRHVRSLDDMRAAEEIANREKCRDFDQFRPLFRQVESDIKAGVRQTRPFGRDASIEIGQFFVLEGQLVYVADKGEPSKDADGHNNARLRAIYANGTESNLLLRSLQKALFKDDAGRRVTEPDAGPLFRDTWEPGDVVSGTIYVLRSCSTHPYIAAHRDVIHKIGMTGGKVETRIANATHEATYLLAEVEVVRRYPLVGIHRTKMEDLLHRIFAPAQISLTIEDRFGLPVHPQEWFLVPLPVIDEAIDRIRDGSITRMVYDVATAQLVEQA